MKNEPSTVSCKDMKKAIKLFGFIDLYTTNSSTGEIYSVVRMVKVNCKKGVGQGFILSHHSDIGFWAKHWGVGNKHTWKHYTKEMHKENKS